MEPTSVSYEEEKKRNPEMKETDIQILREWCEKQSHFPKINDSLLALFFHSNYFRIEPTKCTIEQFFTLRTHTPEFFANRDFRLPEIRKASTVVAAIPLPMRTKEGYIIVYSKFINPDSSAFDFEPSTKFFFMSADLQYIRMGTANGVVFVGDASGISMGHLTRLNLLGIKKLVIYIQEALPIRLKSIHVINTVPVIETIINMAKPFMQKELIDLIHIHTDPKNAQNYFPLESLPNEAGGKAGKLIDLHNARVKCMEEQQQYFLETESKLRVNESLRIGQPKTAGDLFGVDGSFRKLDID